MFSQIQSIVVRPPLGFHYTVDGAASLNAAVAAAVAVARIGRVENQSSNRTRVSLLKQLFASSILSSVYLQICRRRRRRRHPHHCRCGVSCHCHCMLPSLLVAVVILLLLFFAAIEEKTDRSRPDCVGGNEKVAARTKGNSFLRVFLDFQKFKLDMRSCLKTLVQNAPPPAPSAPAPAPPSPPTKRPSVADLCEWTRAICHVVQFSAFHVSEFKVGMRF